ncbi:MAG: TIGR04282 family arsenosugar biosynthesis glycosyltransferase [Deinococcales bacterium]|nr:TIGR04282 family arsenosugar biosynthesis glycosyltransferase [Chitinophagaceae bacterium]
MTKNALIIFVKNPVEGQVKTRLAKAIGNGAAVAVYQHLLQHTFLITKNLVVEKFVFYGDYINDNDLWLNNLYQKQQQQGFDLGERMKNAFKLILDSGYDKAIIIGSDCYELTQQIIEEAFDDLIITDTVIGPCNDGGYYLLGMKQLIPELFDNIQWSTNDVLPATTKVLLDLQLQYELLPILNDVDDEAGLPKALKPLM